MKSAWSSHVLIMICPCCSWKRRSSRSTRTSPRHAKSWRISRPRGQRLRTCCRNPTSLPTDACCRQLETEINEKILDVHNKLLQAGVDQKESEREARLKETLASLQRIFPGQLPSLRRKHLT